MSKIIAIEGVCCSGKSTLARNLGSRGFGVVKEYDEYANSQFPELAANQEDLVENTKFFIELERRRFRDSLITIANHQVLILDRSFITCCAFDYAAFAGTELSQCQHVVEDMWREEKEKINPDIVILLEISHENFLKRLKKSGKTLTPLLRNQRFNRDFNYYLRKVPTSWGIETFVINTNDLDASRVIQQVFQLL